MFSKQFGLLQNAEAKGAKNAGKAGKNTLSDSAHLPLESAGAEETWVELSKFVCAMIKSTRHAGQLFNPHA
jgi:hypothetical protein